VDLCETIKASDAVPDTFDYSCWIENFQEFLNAPENEGGLGTNLTIPIDEDLWYPYLEQWVTNYDGGISAVQNYEVGFNEDGKLIYSKF